MKHRVILREELHGQLTKHLLSGFQTERLQEEVCLALWKRGDGASRYTGIIGEVVLPADGDRDLHGNVTLQSAYLNRVLDRALQTQAGVAVLHSHPGPGWQNLSAMDDDTERRIISPYIRETGLPLLGLTLGSDAVWSARFWKESARNKYEPVWCSDVRRVGARQTWADSPPNAYPPYSRRESQVRTVDSWGIRAQARLARTHVCVVGAGSVGSIVIEILARTGFEEITIVDPDVVEEKNLDRLIFADRSSLGKLKAEVAARRSKRIATAHSPVIRPIPVSVCTERGYRCAADADVLISCVDNPAAREVLNHIAYSNCLPIIDGGVLVESNARLLSAKWRIHLSGPDMRCLRCRDQYNSSDARDERLGIRRGGRYIADGCTHEVEPGQNTSVFCSVVAAEQMRMLVRYLIGEDWWHDTKSTAGMWSFESRFVEAETESFEHPGRCVGGCEFSNKRLGQGVAGRPTYPFELEPNDGWAYRVKHWFRQTPKR